MMIDEDRRQLRRVLDGAGLEAAYDACVRHAVPAYAVVAAGRAAEGAPLGGTRWGGSPDLPQGVEWPTDKDGKVGNFFAQLDLADLALRAPGVGLPVSGLLSLFTTYLESAAEPVVVAAIHTPAGVPLARRTPPADEEEFADPEIGLLEPIAVEFVPIVSVPFSQREFRRELGQVLDQDQVYELVEVLGGEQVKASIGQLGGFGNPYSDDDFRRILYFHRVGRSEAQWADHYASRDEWQAARSQATSPTDHVLRHDADFAWIFDHADEIEQESSRWGLVLRIDSNHAMNLWINDADPIYFYAPSTEVSSGRFGHVEAMVTQG